jgi:hypothetical protein
MAIAGTIAIQGSETIKLRAVESMRPREGVGGGTPKPTKLSDASSIIPTAKRIEA